MPRTPVFPPTSLDAHPDGVRALVRTGRAGRDAVEWSEPFESALHLQRDGTGRTCVLALREADFAEFDPRRSEEAPGLFVTEDYYLELLRVPA